MNTDPLAELKDIHLPEPISQYPIAPGYIFLEIMGFIFFLWIIITYMQLYKANTAKRHALKELKNIHSNYLNTKELITTCANINQLLKRVALVYYPRINIASLHNDEWIKFLENSSSKISFQSLRLFLIKYPYQKEHRTLDHQHQQINRLFSTTKCWIQQQRKRRDSL